MKQTLKRIVAMAAAIVVISPVLPFYLLIVIGEWSQRWEWPYRVLDAGDRILDWGDVR